MIILESFWWRVLVNSLNSNILELDMVSCGESMQRMVKKSYPKKQYPIGYLSNLRDKRRR